MKKQILLLLLGLLFTQLSVVHADEKVFQLNNDNLYNPGDIKKKAEKYFSQEEYQQALFYLEKWLEKEPKNQKVRYKYAFSLLMSGNFAQGKKELEKILSLTKDKDLIAAVNKLKKQLADYEKNKPEVVVEETKAEEQVVNLDKKSKTDYLCSNVNPTILTNGRFLRWAKDDFPIKVYIPLPPKEITNEGNKYIKLVEKGMRKWSEQYPDIVFEFASAADEANITIKWHDYFKDQKVWGYAYLPNYNSKKDKRETSINLAIRAQPGTATFSNEAVKFGDDELMAIITHETGHALGLGHSPDKEDIMTVSFHSVFPEFQWKITKRDLETLKKLYSLPDDTTFICK